MGNLRRSMPAVIGAVLALALVLAGCAGDDSDTGEAVSSDDISSDDRAAGDVATEGAASPGADGEVTSAGDLDSGDDAGPADEAGGEADAMQDNSSAEGDRAEDPLETGAPSIGGTPGEGSDVPTALTPADLGRDLVFRATITVEVADVAGAAAEAAQRVKALGGLVFGQTSTTDPEPQTVLTFKIVPADFETALAELAGVGSVTTQEITTDDVTERVVDLESRIRTSEASVLRLRDLLDGAGDVNIIANLEGQLLQRETELEQLRGQLRTLSDQVDLATITLTVTQSPTIAPPAGIATGVWLGADADAACPGSAEFAATDGDTAVLCVEVENVGEAELVDVELESESLRLRTADFDIVSGDLSTLAPGDHIVATIDLDIDDGRVRRRDVGEGLTIDVIASAEPAETGTFSSTVESRGETVLVVDDSEGLPGFGDAVGTGTWVLVVVADIVVLLVGLAVPFLPFIALAGAVIWWRRRSTPPSDTPQPDPAV